MSVPKEELEEFADLLARFRGIPALPPPAVETPVSDSELAEYGRLLLAFRRLPKPQARSFKTLAEIADFARRETACSNILAYFLDPKEEHGFRDLFLRSMLQAVSPELKWETWHVETVEREVQTDLNKRLDIVIEGDTFIIGIENKIDAGADYNPFADYKKYLEQRAATAEPKKTVLAILLQLRKEQPADLHGFKPVLYRDLFSAVQSNLGPALVHANPRSITYLIDFITTIQHLEKGTLMDERMLEFFKQNEESAVRFYKQAQELAKDLRRKVTVISKRLDRPGTFKPPSMYSKVNEESEFSDAVLCDCVLPGGLPASVIAEITLKKGWRITVWNRAGDMKAHVVEKWLSAKGILTIRKEDEEWIYAELPFEEAEETVLSKFQELITKIGESLAYGHFLREIVSETEGLVLDECDAFCMSFAPTEWKKNSILLQGKDWVASNLMLLFDFGISKGGSIDLSLILGPGPAETRELLFELCEKLPDTFRGAEDKLSAPGDYSALYRFEFVPKEMLGGASEAVVTETIRSRWQEFIDNDLPKIREAINSAAAEK